MEQNARAAYRYDHIYLSLLKAGQNRLRHVSRTSPDAVSDDNGWQVSPLMAPDRAREGAGNTVSPLWMADDRLRAIQALCSDGRKALINRNTDKISAAAELFS
ncbi:hypothetical protein IFU37_023320 (plasmid) [Pantoea agglomerans]|uniref:hypothetical protein n=1 Tax=Enterobacter agglomerans TaxID=549 RepID=UPI00177C5169|nr:hypothetical protein [Pantoea agglomerans]WVL92374.1 hypothetical protein IFU37_023320 [Pantoea agglomerans]